MTGLASIEAHAKLNLFLRVLSREADGFHGLETLFCLVDLSDRIQVARQAEKGITIEVEGADVGPPEGNLAVRAASLGAGLERRTIGPGAVTMSPRRA